MHPGLVQAIVLAAIANAPDGTKRHHVSTVRERAENMIVASMVVALAQPQ